MPPTKLRGISPLLLIMLTGCAWTVKPPAKVSDPVSVYLTDYGRHTSLIMPLSDDHLIEYAVGDWDWFAVNQNDSWSAVRAVTFSRGATLGRRLFVKTDNLHELKRLSGADRLVELRVDGHRVRKLTDLLDRQYTARMDTWHFNPLTHLDHVRSDRPYWGLNNCNNYTAAWLRQLNCNVSGWTILSNFKLSSPPPASSTQPVATSDAAAD